jgi:hypothetical protein
MPPRSSNGPSSTPVNARVGGLTGTCTVDGGEVGVHEVTVQCPVTVAVLVSSPEAASRSACVTEYTVTPADVARGSLVNNAVAVGVNTVGAEDEVASSGAAIHVPIAGPPPAAGHNTNAGNGLSGGVIAAIVLGAIAGIAAVGAGASGFAQRRSR